MKILALFFLALIASCTTNETSGLYNLETPNAEFATAAGEPCCCDTCIDCGSEPENPGVAESVLRNINSYRARAGAAPVVLDTRLTCAADKHSKDIGESRTCSHYGRDGSSPWDRAARCGTSANGEIVACGHTTPEAAVLGWYNSTGHRNIMLNKSFKKVGIGMFNNYWTAIFSY